MPLYEGLNDSFDRDNGQTASYVDDSTFAPLVNRKHYDLRVFTPNDNWTADPDVTVATDATRRYMNTIQIDLDDGVEKTVSSVRADDIETGFTGEDYFIELVLPDLPAQTDVARLDLDKSFVDFSSDADFEFDLTDRVALSESLDPLDAGGDVSFRINRDRLVNADPANLQAIRFRLFATSAPATAPTIASGGAGLISDDIDYKVTFVVGGVESMPSPISNTITVSNEQVDLTNIPLGPTGTTDRKIYRRVAAQPIYPSETTYPSNTTYPASGVTGSVYGLVTTINNNTATTFTDNVTSLGGEPPTTSTLGELTFVAAAMRVLPDSYTFEEIDTDTKRGLLVRSIQQDASEPGTTFGTLVFPDTKAADATMTIAFRNGQNPTGADNTLRIYLRISDDATDSIEARLQSRDTQSRLFIVEEISGVPSTLSSTPINTNILTEDADHRFVVKCDGDEVTVSVYEGNSLVYSLGPTTVSNTSRGLIGYSFEPYHYDFTMDWIGASNVTFGRFESKSFASITPVVGATIIVNTSDPVNVISDDFIAYGDAALDSASIGQPAPSRRVVRSGSGASGGIIQTTSGSVGTSLHAAIVGDIYIPDQVRGQYQVQLIDTADNVSFTKDIEGLLPNQWQHFSIALTPGMEAIEYKLVVQQVGSFADTFYIDNLAINHATVAWEASADNGTNWQPFLAAINDPFTGVNFLNRGTQLKVRAIAFSDQAWIQGYQLIPKYAYPGH